MWPSLSQFDESLWLITLGKSLIRNRRIVNKSVCTSKVPVLIRVRFRNEKADRYFSYKRFVQTGEIYYAMHPSATHKLAILLTKKWLSYYATRTDNDWISLPSNTPVVRFRENWLYFLSCIYFDLKLENAVSIRIRTTKTVFWILKLWNVKQAINIGYF